MNDAVHNTADNTADNSPYPTVTDGPASTVRLGFLWRGAGWALGSLAGLLLAFTLAESGAVEHLGVLPSLLLVTAAAVALPAPRTFRLRADEQGLTLTRLLLSRRYRWQDVTGLEMDFGEDSESGSPRLALRLRLTTTRRTGCGPALGTLPTTGDRLPRGTEPPELADLFTLLDRHGVRLDAPHYAALVLSAHGRPPLGRR
ncbi:PH domain-containing protein [Streptomyces sp. SP17BM10]|uniref:PH domain-containing protein n=1 Tax=Streptomyces sp. SP17BM10 TaxID=3002530 RepID=UPI002E79B595|nr:PH domain-containing protein [Streptomyces sp. SP17BM10]MEE1781761.1 PH domain-containing protein [Streptomyces sp. SP17BM10]